MHFHRFKLISALAVWGIATTAAMAQFTGEFTLPDSGTYTATQSFTNWDLNVSFVQSMSTNSSGTADTTSAPNSLLLSALGFHGVGGVGNGTATVTFSHVATASLNLSFDLNFTASGIASYAVEVDGQTINPLSSVGADSTYGFGVSAGDTLSFIVSGTGTAGSVMFMGPTPLPLPGSDGTGAITISNFSASAVPEPSTWAGIGGLLALGFAAWRRNRRA